MNKEQLINLEIIKTVLKGYNLYRGVLIMTLIFGLIAIGLLIYFWVMKKRTKKKLSNVQLLWIGIFFSITFLCYGVSMFVNYQNGKYLTTAKYDDYNDSELKLIPLEIMVEEDSKDSDSVMRFYDVSNVKYKTNLKKDLFKEISFTVDQTIVDKKVELKISPTDFCMVRLKKYSEGWEWEWRWEYRWGWGWGPLIDNIKNTRIHMKEPEFKKEMKKVKEVEVYKLKLKPEFKKLKKVPLIRKMLPKQAIILTENGRW